MLVLSRKRSESIVIGDDAEIEIFVVDIRNDKVRIGIRAPEDIEVNRREVHEAKRKSKKEGEE